MLLEPELPSARLVSALDGWENRWFPIVEIVLRTNHPRVHEVVFHNLRQTQGPQVVVSVATLLDRLDAIARPAAEGGLVDEGRAARELLAVRGLSEDVVAEARELLARVGASPATDADRVADGAARAQAEQHLWSWHLEWTGIARVAIRDRRVRASLGFRPPGRKRGSEDG